MKICSFIIHNILHFFYYAACFTLNRKINSPGWISIFTCGGSFSDVCWEVKFYELSDRVNFGLFKSLLLVNQIVRSLFSIYIRIKFLYNYSILRSCCPRNGYGCDGYSHKQECNLTACTLVTTFGPSPLHLLMGLVCVYYYGSLMVPGYIIVQHMKPDGDGQRGQNWVRGGGVKKKIQAKFVQAWTTIPRTTPQGAKVQHQEKESTIPSPHKERYREMGRGGEA